MSDMSIPSVITRGYGNGTFDPGVNKLPTLGYSISLVVVADLFPRDASFSRSGPGDATFSRSGPGDASFSRSGPGDASISPKTS